MKLFVLSILAMLACAATALAQRPDILWTREAHMDGNRYFTGVCETSDSGFVAVGISKVSGNDYDGLFFKMDVRGDSLWNVTPGGTGNDSLSGVAATSDGGAIGAGTTQSMGAGGRDAWLVKLSASGGIEWQRTCGTAGDEMARAVIQTSDGGYIATGGSVLVPSRQIYVIRTNAQGDCVWTRNYLGPYHGMGNSIEQLPDGGFLIVGTSDRYSGGPTQMAVLRLNANGDTLWTRSFSASSWTPSEGYSGYRTADGGYIVVGSSNALQPFLVRLNANGDSLWMRTYYWSTSDFSFQRVRPTSDGGYVLGGTRDLGGSAGKEFYFMHTNASGDSEWTISAGSPYVDILNDMVTTEYEGVIGVGNSRLAGAPNGYGFVVRMGITGYGGLIHNAVTGEPEHKVCVSVIGHPQTAFTDETGYYMLRMLSGTYDLAVSGPCTARDTLRNQTIPPSRVSRVDWVVNRPQAVTDQSSINLVVHNHLAASAPLTIRNEGRGDLDFHIVAQSLWPRFSWFSVDPDSGTIAAGDSFTVTVAAHADTLDNAVYDYVGFANLHLNSCPDTVIQMGVLGTVLDADGNPIHAPTSFRFGASPNPFNPTTLVSFTLVRSERVTVTVYDLTGRVVQTLADGLFEPGDHAFSFDGRGLASGIYFARLTSPTQTRTAKLMLLR